MENSNNLREEIFLKKWSEKYFAISKWSSSGRLILEAVF
jgi:hypothetical protein